MATLAPLKDEFVSVRVGDACDVAGLHRVSNQCRSFQILLGDERFHVFCHDGVVVSRIMRRVAMVAEILALRLMG